MAPIGGIGREASHFAIKIGQIVRTEQGIVRQADYDER